jgi:hypothetical protein
MSSPPDVAVRRGEVTDAEAIGKLLHDFNREFDEPTPPLVELEQRIAQLLQGGETVVLLVGSNPDGLAVLRFREAIWSSGRECYLAEVYVTPAPTRTRARPGAHERCPPTGPRPRRRHDGNRGRRTRRGGTALVRKPWLQEPHRRRRRTTHVSLRTRPPKLTERPYQVADVQRNRGRRDVPLSNLTHLGGNSEGTPARAGTSTRGHYFSIDPFGVRAFVVGVTRGCPGVPTRI